MRGEGTRRDGLRLGTAVVRPSVEDITAADASRGEGAMEAASGERGGVGARRSADEGRGMVAGARCLPRM